jgi:hypothetical protein
MFIAKSSKIEREDYTYFNNKIKEAGYNPASFLINAAWQRPTLAGALAPTTIGAGELNFRVRDGNGCDLSAIVTRPTTLILLPCRSVPRNPSASNKLVDAGTGCKGLFPQN